jgi:deoxyribonuclease-1-like protein
MHFYSCIIPINEQFHFDYFSFFFVLFFYSKTKLLSWNLENLRKPTSEIAFIAETVREYDNIKIHEVAAGNRGIQAVARLSDGLNRKGDK